MKVNTDGVLLAALVNASEPAAVLDIGAGTGVIALMLAQRFPNSRIDAVEIDAQAAVTAHRNFETSPFFDRLTLHPGPFVDFLQRPGDCKYDLIVTNPPFFLNSLKSEKAAKQTARHADPRFFRDLFTLSAEHLRPNGMLALVLPVDTAEAINPHVLAAGFRVNSIIAIQSYPESAPHRQIITYSLGETEVRRQKFVIYEAEKVYSKEYQLLLKDFFTIF